ncbi:MAG: endonuclease Q family protein [Candidatus Pacearchaeota archaeon]|nr:endonuclease Q family protein [Candidatus Pacearchaeota archaeon]
MQVISDLHIHSRFSRATSKDLTIANLEKWAKIKGISLLGTGDFSHPAWLQELKKELKEYNGILKTKTNFSFLLTNEVCLSYQKEKQRNVHLLLLAPDFEVVEQVNTYFKKLGRIDVDGRPNLNVSCSEFVEEIMRISEKIEIIPAHVWTSWFGIFGSVTGFDSMEEAFEDKTKYIHAFETGMSSNPEMNWRLSFLDDYTILSFSDSHSFWPWRLGREATVFELKEDFTYEEIINSIRKKRIALTIETPPEYGKYHFDGHRKCGFSCSPQEAIQLKNVCPVCGKPLTIGVLHRVEELADRREGFKPVDAVPFKQLLPLHEVIALAFSTTFSSKKVWKEYEKLVSNFDNEFNVLLNVPFEQLSKVIDKKIAEAIIKNREGKIKIKPGFDGKYGEPIFYDQKRLV